MTQSLRTSPAYAPRPGITAIPQPQAVPCDDTNFHNFGYVEGCPAVSLRVAIESGAVAASVNARLFGAEGER